MNFDKYFYKPNLFQKILACLLLPVSILYCLVATFKRKIAPKRDFNIKIISIGNIVVGGSGKTPFIIALASFLSKALDHKIAIVSRGYKRTKRGTFVVGDDGIVNCDVASSGDEPYLIALNTKAMVIVGENRAEAVELARDLGAKIVLLDDGFRFNFKKLNILLRPKIEPYYKFCLPSGAYREGFFSYREADILLRDDINYKRKISLINPTKKMLLVSAIANPIRLFDYLIDYKTSIVGHIFYDDHSGFDLEELQKLKANFGAISLLVTEKDLVKMLNFDINLSVIKLDLEIQNEVLNEILNYIKG